MNQIKKYLPLLIVVLLAFWQVALMQHLLKWDNVDYFLPMRHFFSNELRQGILPGWNPFVNLGFPHYADPQSGAWYPIVWVFSIFKSYGFASLNLEWIIHVLLGGMGMYKLLEGMKLNKAAIYLGSIAFMLSGFNVGTAQILPFIIGACWLPWCLWGFKRFLDEPSLRSSAILSLLLYLQITGSYPAFSIVLTYILLVWWLVAMVKNKAAKTVVFKQTFLVAALTLALSSGFIYTFAMNLSELGRSSELVFDQTFVKNSFTFQSWLSFLWPYGTSAEIGWFNSDTSMINGFVGLTTLILFLISPFVLKSRYKWLAIGGVFFFLFSAMADVFPLRFWLYKFVPGFAHFKHPSLLRLYAMFLMILLASFTFHQLGSSKKFARFQSYLFLTFAIIGLGAVLQHVQGLSATSTAFYQWRSCAEVSHLLISDHMAVQGLVTLLLSLVFYFLHKRFKFKYALVFFLAAEMIVAAQLNSNITVINKNALGKNEVALQNIAKVEPVKPTNLEDAAQVSVDLDDIWQNKSVLKKTWAYNGYNPYMQSSFLKFRESNEIKEIAQLPVVWEKNELFTDLPSKGKIDLKRWNSQSILCDIQVDDVPFELVFTQNRHDNWKFFLNGEPVEHHSEFDALMGIDIKVPGTYSLELKFSNEEYKRGILFTLIGWLFFGAVLLLNLKKLRVSELS